jgi:diaminohydroxyphosphoribosylaminopyrimidine deaminase/5-amino-6-(5-phosphoribosylamino)uracil reductase
MTTGDEQFMLEAIAQGELARRQAPPNPWVGCVIAQGGVIVGKGSTQVAGGPHAEVMALREAGPQACGATAYVSLEPCSHHGRTPPCVEALIAASIARVVIAIEDPDLRVRGKGIAQLKEAGIDVTVGVGAQAATESLRPYLHHRRTQKPYCLLKTALSIDGATAAADGSSQWITSESARLDLQSLRGLSQAIVVGAHTVRIDNPQLTVRVDNYRPAVAPLRVVVSKDGRFNPTMHIFNCREAPTLLATTRLCSPLAQERWHRLGVEVAILPHDGGQIDLQALLDLLGERGIIQLLVEGGASLHRSFVVQQLFDQLTVYVGDCLLGSGSKDAFGNLRVTSIHHAPRLQLIGCKPLGSSVRLDYLPMDLCSYEATHGG